MARSSGDSSSPPGLAETLATPTKQSAVICLMLDRSFLITLLIIIIYATYHARRTSSFQGLFQKRQTKCLLRFSNCFTSPYQRRQTKSPPTSTSHRRPDPAVSRQLQISRNSFA